MITLDELIREYLIENGESGEHKYSRCNQIALSAIREMNMDVNGLPKATFIDVNKKNFTAQLPKDYITHNRIGVVAYGNIFQPLGIEDRIIISQDDVYVCEVVENNNQDLDSSSQVYYNDQSRNTGVSGQYVGKEYGLGGGLNRFGYYRVDRSEGIIYLSSACNEIDKLYIEYLSNPLASDEEIYVHDYDVEAIKAFIYWKWIQRDKTYNEGEKQTAQLEWLRQKKLSKIRNRSFTIEEFKRMVQLSNKQIPKY